uniref:Rx N-terminal domain-containing protein n=1 Tax=Oryza punctata TaxID=4537 RepID=A0A0E0JKF7_ORYPU
MAAHQTIVEEAQGRQISNQGMLLQLKQLMECMYQGYFILDTFQEPNSIGKHITVRQSRKLNELQVAMEGIEATINHMEEFVVFLLDCPRLPRQPYDTHLFMEKCMFGRHEEKDFIRHFLLQPCDYPLSVLPIIGPREGRTQIEHVYNEESVREHLSQIVRFKSDDLNN